MTIRRPKTKDQRPRFDESAVSLVLGPRSIVVIGYGNELRGDDAIGMIVAEQVASRGWPNVCAIATRQLLPELAEDLARVGLAIFVDARPLIEQQTQLADEERVEWQALTP
ncbi:MAG TPA: hypothetical protein VFU22_20525, partial [Roseiflexaceae bacterium]|nr:hypothetical protein [Roseiflexaceae bacterium]